MKKQNVLTAAILLAATSVTTTAFAVPAITDYTQATSAYEDAYISGNFNANSGNQDFNSYELDLDLDYEKVFSSPSRNTSLDFNASGSSRKPAKKSVDPVTNLEIDGSEKSTNTYSALGTATVDNYFRPGSKAGFWYGRGEVGLQKGADSAFTKLTAGVGYGRVVNVTPMALSIRIIESLRENGFMNGDPSDAVYQQVAQIVDKEDEYKSKYGSADYEQYWVQDIQATIQASGKVKGNLNARAILKSYDVLTQERISTRKNGWLVRAGVGAVITDYDGEDGKPALELVGEYHRPISNQTQFSNKAVATATLKDDDDGFNFNNDMSLTHEISDKIDWENSWNLSHTESDNSKPLTSNTLSSAFYYNLTNQLDLGIIGKLSKTDDRIDYNGNLEQTNRNDEVDKSINIGVKYRLK